MNKPQGKSRLMNTEIYSNYQHNNYDPLHVVLYKVQIINVIITYGLYEVRVKVAKIGIPFFFITLTMFYDVKSA